MAMATRVAGDKECHGGKSDGDDGDAYEERDGGGGNEGGR